jgi:LuxR family quorum sensing-dependent transcriptional regulator
MADPVVTKLQRTPDPFLWTEVWTGTGSRAETRVMNEATSFGMRQGFVVPIFGVGGTVHGISFSGREPRDDGLARAELHLVAMYAYARAKRLSRREPEPSIAITLREREAMQWAAAGKSDWEIGEVLGISESAAHKRIESAKKKYRVATRVQAIVEALRHGHIQI